MTDIKSVTPSFAVAPQLDPADLATAAARGFTLVINNRPDGEAPDQPSGAQMAAAAEAAGLAYVAIPVRGGPTPEQVAAMRAAIAGAPGPVLAFCRSGTRSIFTWALGEAEAGTQTRRALAALGQAAGYDLSPALGAS
jgi:uncharacterized protein (TIGR01244 family)